MITKNPMQLKAIIKNKAKEKNISAQLVMQNYMLERLLERISLSKYRNNFILKGGFLISAIVGLDTRSTMDLDTTIKGVTLTHEKITEIFNVLCSIHVDDDVTFELMGISDIREGDDYPGIRVSLKANYDPISVPLAVDVTTGDIITPQEIKYSFKMLFDDRAINVWAYNLETVMAEKIETILSRGVANTRPRDFYDTYILWMLHKNDLDLYTLKNALQNTINKRGSVNVLNKYTDIIKQIRNSFELNGFWQKYIKEYEYASNIPFDKICGTILEIMNSIS